MRSSTKSETSLIRSDKAGMFSRSWVPPELSLTESLSRSREWTGLHGDLKDELQAQARRHALDQAEQLIAVAHQQADELLKQAEAASGEITRQAYDQGLAAAQERATQILAAAQKILSEMQTWQLEMLGQSEKMILELVTAVAQKIFGAGLVLEPGVLKKAFEAALAEARPLGDLRIRAHPEDIALLGSSWPTEQAALSGQRIELTPDRGVQRGACLVEGQYGSVDARLGTQFHRIQEALDKVAAANAFAAHTPPFNEQESTKGVL